MMTDCWLNWYFFLSGLTLQRIKQEMQFNSLRSFKDEMDD